MAPQRFKTSIKRSGSRMFIVVPFNPDDVWGPKERHYIDGLVNGLRECRQLDVAGDQFFLSLGAAWQQRTGIEEGTKVSAVYRKNFVRWVESAKRPQTRAARIAEMDESLKARQ